MRKNIRSTRESSRWLVIYSPVLIVTCEVCCVNGRLYAVLVAPLPAPMCVGRLGSYNTVLYASATDGLVFN